MVTVPAAAADGAGEGGCDGLGVCAARVTPAMAKAPQAAMICRPMILPPRPTERTRSPARLHRCRIRARRCSCGPRIGTHQACSPALPGDAQKNAKVRPTARGGRWQSCCTRSDRESPHSARAGGRARWHPLSDRHYVLTRFQQWESVCSSAAAWHRLSTRSVLLSCSSSAVGLVLVLHHVLRGVGDRSGLTQPVSS